MRLGTAYVVIKDKSDDLRRGLVKARRDVDSATKNMQKSIERISFAAAKMAVVAFGAAVVYNLKKAVDAASDLQEVQGKFDVVFKGQEKVVEGWAKTLVNSYAMSEREAKQYLSSVQDLLVPMGMNAKAASKMSNEVVKLAADLGSFNNVPTAQVMMDIQSALVGNFETMKKYGVILNETVVKQKALELGLWSGKGMVDANTKAFIAFKLMVKDSAAAVGDMARTSGSYANQVKKMNANIETLRVVLGNELLPVATKIVAAFNDWVKVNDGLIKQKVESTVKAIADSVKSVVDIYNAIPEEVIGAGGAGLVGRMVFGSWGPAKWMVMIGAIDSILKKANEILTIDILPTPSMAIEGWRLIGVEAEKYVNYLIASGKQIPKIFKGEVDFFGSQTGAPKITLPMPERTGPMVPPSIIPPPKMMPPTPTPAVGITPDKATVKKDLDERASAYQKHYDYLLSYEEFKKAEVIKIAAEETAAKVDAWKKQQDYLLSYAEFKKTEELKAQKTITDGIRDGLRMMVDDYGSSYKAALLMTQQFANSARRSISDGLFGYLTGEMNSFKDAWKGFTNSLLRSFTDMLADMAVEWAASGVTKWITGLGGGDLGGGGGGGFLSGVTKVIKKIPIIGSFFHGGGVVGKTMAPTMAMPALAFAGAPRFHQGFTSNEFPAVLERGEGVFTKDQMKSLGSPGPLNITVMVGGEEFEAIIANVADGVRVKAERRSMGVRRIYD